MNDDVAGHETAATAGGEEELLALRLRVEGLERDLEAANGALMRRTAQIEALPYRNLWRLTARADRVRHAFRPDTLVAGGYEGAGPEGLRIPLAGLPATVTGAGGEVAAATWSDAVTLDAVPLPALLADPDLTISFRLAAAGGAQLRAFAGLRPPAWARNRGGVRFAVTAATADGRVLATVQRDVDPGVRRADRRWVPLTLALPAHDGELVLTLATSLPPAASPAFSWAVWGDPVLLTGGGAAIAPLPRGRAAVAAAARSARRRRGGAPAAPPPSGAPVVSLLLPVHDPDPELLAATLASVREQGDDGWELSVTDDGSTDPRVRALLDDVAADPRVHLARHDHAQGIAAATNRAFAAATGTFVAALDHDDLLAPGAIAAVRAALAADPAVDILYSDNDKVGAQDVHFAPSLKPGWSPDLLRACMYTLHLGVYRRSLVEAVGGWRPDFDGAQDHDLVLRLSERTERIAHLPQTLYSWRVHEGSAALGELAKPYAYDRAVAAIDEHLTRVGVPAHAERLPDAGRYRVVREPPPPGAVAVVVPVPGDLAAGDLGARLADAVEALAAAGEPGLEIVVACGPATVAAGAELGDMVRVVSGPDNTWASLVRAGADATAAPLLVLLEELAAPAAPGWEAEIAGPLAEAGIVAVAPLLLDGDGRVLQAGVSLAAGLPLPLFTGADTTGATPPPELTMVTDRSAAGGVVAIRRGALSAVDPTSRRLGLVALTSALTREAGRVLCTPHAPWRVVGAARTAVTDVAELHQLARALDGRHDPFVNPRLWADRAAHVVPRALRPAGRLGDIDRV